MGIPVYRCRLKDDEANRARMVVTNRTDRKVSPALALAIFDAEGRLLAAANTGARLKKIKPGVTAELDIHFGGVFRHLDRVAADPAVLAL